MKKSRLGLTLIELIVVVAILGVLAAMLLPKFEGLQSAANHTAAAGSISDLNLLIGAYKTAKTVYPSGWDSLMDSSGSMWTAGSAGSQTKGLHTQITGTSSTSKLTTASLDETEIQGLINAGIATLYTLTTGTIGRAGDAFTVPKTLTGVTTLPVAVVNTASPNGIKIIDRFYRQNAVANTPGVVNGDNTKNKLVVFGVGPLCSLIPNSMMEAPTYGQANATYVYNRLLVVFQVTSTGSVTYKGCLASDGDLLDDISVNMQTGTF